MEKCVRESHLGPMLFWTSLTFIAQKKKKVHLEEEKAQKASSFLITVEKLHVLTCVHTPRVFVLIQCNSL